MNNHGCGAQECTSISGLGTGTVQLGVVTWADASIGRMDAIYAATFPLYTLGPVAPGTLSLSLFADGDGSLSPGINRTGYGSGTVFDLETGTPVPIYTWLMCGGCAQTVSLPMDIGVPFSITLQAEAQAWTNVSPPLSPVMGGKACTRGSASTRFPNR